MPLTRVDLTRKLQPLPWFIGDLLLQGYLNFIASLPGIGKTAILTALAWQASRPEGRGSFLGRPVRHGASIYIDFDAPGEGRSFRFWLDKHRRAHPDGDDGLIHVLEPDLDTFGMQDPELREVGIRAREVNAQLIIVDSFMAAFPRTNPVKLTEVQAPLWHLRGLAYETGAAVVLIDHLPKPMGGERAGARGVMGSIAKWAQARTVHLLTRVPPEECGRRHVLRWEVQKMSYGALPAPFGLELRFADSGSLTLEPGSLLSEESGFERAVREMQSALEIRRGDIVERRALLEIAAEEGDLGLTAAKRALRSVLEGFGEEVERVRLPGPGTPLGYRLAPMMLFGATQIGDSSS